MMTQYSVQKMTTLADLYAVGHRDGYAKFNIEDEDKLRFIDEKLEFLLDPDTYRLYVDDVDLTYQEFDTGILHGQVTSSGLDYYGGNTSTKYTWTYSGSGTFEGFSTTSDSSQIDYAIGDSLPTVGGGGVVPYRIKVVYIFIQLPQNPFLLVGKMKHSEKLP